MQSNRHWVITVLSSFSLILLLLFSFIVVIDPFWHFHKPLSALQYPLKEERYINDGIQRHFDYEIMVTGTSMAWNMNVSTIEECFNKKAIKTAYSGATFHEISEGISRAIAHNPSLNTVICSLDPNKLADDSLSFSYDGYPTYLFDNNYLNDVNYIFNKDVLTEAIAVINYTRAGNTTPSFDMYGRFDTYQPHGKEAVLSTYTRPEISDMNVCFTEKTQKTVNDNITINFLSLADKYPNINFIFFIPPYSVCYWDSLVRTGQLDYVIEEEKYALSLLADRDNIEIYGFDSEVQYTWNLEYYTDTLHYTGDVCDYIIKNIHSGSHQITADTLNEYFDNVISYYTNNIILF